MNIDLTNPKEIEAVVNRLKREKEEKISSLLIEIDRLKAKVTAQKKELKEELNDLFIQLEIEALKLPNPQQKEALEAIAEIKLKSLEFLGILSQTTESALINALEKGENIEETILEITKELTFETIDYEVDKKKIIDVSTTILEVALSLAQSVVNYSDEILRGSIIGVKKGIQKSISKFNEMMEYTPDEVKSIILSNHKEIVKDLQNIDKIYQQVIKDIAAKSEPGIKEKIVDIADSNNIFEKLKTEAQKAVDTLKKRFDSLLSDEILNRANEAKRLGLLAFEKAKKRLKSIKETKDESNK